MFRLKIECLGGVDAADFHELSELELGPVLRLVDLLVEEEALDRRQLVQIWLRS